MRSKHKQLQPIIFDIQQRRQIFPFFLYLFQCIIYVLSSFRILPNNIIKTAMLHNNLKTHFQDKQQQLFQIHLNSNHHTKSLFQDVLRKNNDMIRNCLSKFNDIYNRIEEYQIATKTNTEQLQKVNAGNERFYFQFRKTHLSLEKKQNQLYNDVSMIKNLLKINRISNKDKLPNSGENLKEKGHKTVMNAKRPKQHCFSRSKTNYGPEKNQISIDILHSSNIQQISNQETNEQIIKQQNESLSNNLPQNLINFNWRQIVERQKQEKEQLIEQVMQIYQKKYEQINKQTLQLRLNEFSLSMEAKINKMITDKIDTVKQQQIQTLKDFFQKQNEQKSKLIVSKHFLQESMLNLKNAWERQQKHLMQLIQTKVSTSIYETVEIKIEEIEEQIKKINNILLLKTQLRNLNLNSYHKQFPSNRATSKQSMTDKLYIEAQSSCKRYIVNQQRKVKHNFSNSLSRISPKSGKPKQSFINVQNLTDFDYDNQAITQKMWKQKAYNALGQSKTLKRSKHQR